MCLECNHFLKLHVVEILPWEYQYFTLGQTISLIMFQLFRFLLSLY